MLISSKLVDSKMVLLPSIRSIPTASVDRYYTEIQSCLTAAVFPSYLSAISLCLLLRMWCSGDRSKNRYSTLTLLVDLRDLVNRLYGRSLRSYHSVDEHSLLSCWVYLTLLYGAPANRSPSPILLHYFLFCFLSYCRLWACRLTGLINIMLV